MDVYWDECLICILVPLIYLQLNIIRMVNIICSSAGFRAQVSLESEAATSNKRLPGFYVIKLLSNPFNCQIHTIDPQILNALRVRASSLLQYVFCFAEQRSILLIFFWCLMVFFNDLRCQGLSKVTNPFVCKEASTPITQ